jgi:hypothetical protein
MIYGLGNTYLGDVFVFPRGNIDDDYLLLRDCTAHHDAYGTGTWSIGNGGWLIKFADRQIGFPKQEPPPVDTEVCGS